MNVDKS